MRSKIITFIISLLLWMCLSASFDWQHITIGIIIASFVAFTMGDMFADQAWKWFNIKRYLWFGIYIIVFTGECIKANIDVAARVLSPRLPINPGIVKVKTILKTESSLTFLANSITLTPGTLSVDIDRENGILYIHWIYVKSEDIERTSRIIVSKFERILKEVFE